MVAGTDRHMMRLTPVSLVVLWVAGSSFAATDSDMLIQRVLQSYRNLSSYQVTKSVVMKDGDRVLEEATVPVLFDRNEKRLRIDFGEFLAIGHDKTWLLVLSKERDRHFEFKTEKSLDLADLPMTLYTILFRLAPDIPLLLDGELTELLPDGEVKVLPPAADDDQRGGVAARRNGL